MMSILEAIILGIVQGATEFLPVSSSGHSVLIPAVFGFEQPSLNAIAIAHLGTLLAVLIYFFKDIWEITIAFVQGIFNWEPFADVNSRLGWLIIVGTIPVAIIALPLKDWFESIFETPVIAASFLLVTAALIVIGERMLSGKKDFTGMEWLDALIIGTFQTFALFPGVSRSGSTIVGGLIRGLDREAATRFSFLLGIPAILAAGLGAIQDLLFGTGPGEGVAPMATVFIVSAIVGYACIAWLLRWVRNNSLIPFAIYCVAFSLIYLIFFFGLGVDPIFAGAF